MNWGTRTWSPTSEAFLAEIWVDMANRWSECFKGDKNLPTAGGYALHGLCAAVAAVQVLALFAPHPFQGIGVLGFALLPVVFAYHASLLAAIAAGIPLAIACFWFGGYARAAIGVALIALTVANVVPILREREEARLAEARDASQNAAFNAEVAKCSVVMAQRAQEAVTYFSEPRKIVAIGGEYAVEFENGMRIQLPPIQPPLPFREFFYDHLVGSQVRVTLRPTFVEQLTAGCRSTGSAIPPRSAQPFEGDVYLIDRKIDAVAYVDPEFPRPARSDDRASASTKRISRWFDSYSGDRTYAPKGTKPAGEYVLEGQPFAVRVSPAADSVGLYLCNFPLQRPDSPEHFLSTDGACEGYEKIALLGHIGSARDGETPRALVRCLGTVKSPLRTGPRHLATTNILECRNRSIEAVLGYVER